MKNKVIGFLASLCLMAAGTLWAEETTFESRFPMESLYFAMGGTENETGSLTEEDSASIALHPLINFSVGDNSVPRKRGDLSDPDQPVSIDQPYFTTPQFFQNLNEKGIVPFKDSSAKNAAEETDSLLNDWGTTVFGLASMADTVHLKYYFGLYEGAESVGEDTDRLSGRLQFNLMDPDHLKNTSSLGGKKTLGMGISFDGQNDIASENINERMDYKWYGVDAFADMPVGKGVLTMEMAVQKMKILFTDMEPSVEGPEPLKEKRQNNGDGWHFQTGYLIDDLQIQPWAGYETWAVKNNEGEDIDGYDRWKVGFTYFLRENMGNIKAGFEKFKTMPAKEETGKKEDNTEDINTFLLNFTINF